MFEDVLKSTYVYGCVHPNMQWPEVFLFLKTIECLLKQYLFFLFIRTPN
jgi:hypothetical protein